MKKILPQFKFQWLKEIIVEVAINIAREARQILEQWG